MGSTSSNSPNSLQLSLGLKPSYVPKTIANLFSDLAKVDDVQKKLSVLDDYLKKYEEELARVEPFRRDLPQCMLLLMDAIDIMKGEISKLITNHGEEESEFDDQIRRVDEFSKCKRRIYENDGINISPPWSSIQENGTEIHKEMAILASESQKTPMIDSDRFGLSLKVNQAPEIKQQEQFSDPTWKTRTRRHWTHELHARFQWALDVLGGPEAATPKQIKEVMRVSGLTNDQIKSHLQVQSRFILKGALE
ncbi:hypothetical protein TIFTF001_026673 [Ficus carica]|uniref:HTH myb-type domain-containing protein n=1 Tax=Ficus carica TaxID=3494 RepID=A0AA88DMI6_FICCA|nr:hypothetical protein TIFTF001_026673 [Ficus carica]